MNYTLEKLINILRKRLQDEEFNGEILTQFLNDSQNEILGEDKYPFMQRIDCYTAESGGEISLPLGYAGTFHIFARKDKNPRQELTFISPEDFFNNTQKHTMVWTTYSNTLFYRLYHDPDDKGFTVTHLYLINPRPLTKSTDVPAIPPQYIEALILGALARAEEVRDNFDYSQLYRNQQDQLLTNMKLRFGPGNLSGDSTAKLHFRGNYNDHF